MPERSSVNQGVQLGQESTYGTNVTANIRLSALGISLTPDMEFQRFRPAGNKFETVSSLTKEFTSAELTGALTYTEVIYPFRSIFGAATITTPGGGSTSRQHEYVVTATAADAPVSFTVQRGDGTLAEEAAGFVVNTLDISINRDSGIEMTGDGFAKALVHSATAMDTVTVTPSLIPVVPTQVDVYLDDYGSPANEAAVETALGTTKLTRAHEVNLTYGNRYSQVWVLDSAVTGNVAVVEVPVEFMAELVMQADATGYGVLTDARAGTALLMSVVATGAIIEGAIPYSLTFDLVGRVSGGGTVSERDGVEVISWEIAMMYDATWTRAMRVRAVNTATA